MRNIQAGNAHPMHVAKQNTGAGTAVLNAQTQKTAPIIDADFQQARQIALARLARKQAARIIDADARQMERNTIRPRPCAAVEVA